MREWLSYLDFVREVTRTVLTLFLSNIRSIMPKIDSLESTLRLNNINFAFITETWLNQKIDDGAVQIEGYSLVRQDRVNQKGGGGVCICKFARSL